MSQFEGPKNPSPEKPDWSELDSDPIFQKNLVTNLEILILEKKFGVEFYENYQMLSLRKMLETPLSDGEVLISEVADFEDRLGKIKTVEGLIVFAKAENLEITPKELEEAKKHTIEFMASEQ
jgi:hypothetical protein